MLALTAPAFAEDPVEVISGRADTVSVTIYRDLFALVTETRTIDLPAGPVTLSFDGVVETLIPESAVAVGANRPLEERNYDFDQLTPDSLLSKAIGKSVTLTRTPPGTGRVTQTRAVILAANADGILLKSADGTEALHCSGLPERLTFDEMPADLHAKPRLSIRLAAGVPGKRTLTLSYLAHGFAWKSDYVAHLNAASDRMDLKGWVTLRNFTNASLREAEVQLVAGKLHLLPEEERGTSRLGSSDDYEGAMALRDARDTVLNDLQDEQDDIDMDLRMFSGCHALPSVLSGEVQPLDYFGFTDAADIGSLEEVIVTGMRQSASLQAVREGLGDYQLYRLPWATDLNARQTKQAVFLDKRSVKVERFYGTRLDARHQDADQPFSIPQLKLGFVNRKSEGLGEPLPEGVLRLFEPSGNGDVFAGEAEMSDEPVGMPIELDLARALDLTLAVDVDEDTEKRKGEDVADLADVRLSVLNAKSVPVTIEIRQVVDAGDAGARIVKSNHRVGRKFGDYAWRFRVPANGDGSLNYVLRVPYPVEEDEDD